MSGHGWVNPLPGGVKARCGGPGMCPDCQAEEKASGQRLFMRRDEIAAQLSAERDITVTQVDEVLDGLASLGVDVDRLVAFTRGVPP